jgi:hypothetical protein
VAVPPALEAIVVRALAKSRDARFQTAAEMAVALRRLLPSSAPTLVSPEEPPPRSTRRRVRKRRPWLVLLPALSVAFFALGVAFGHALPSARATSEAASGR